jgi:molecular chaperone GrpE
LLPQADPAADVERVEEQLRAEQDRHLRTLADFTNFRRRAERDSKKLAEEGKREVLRSLLDIVDDLENAIRWAGQGEQPLARGVSIVHDKLVALLAIHGVRPIDAAGKPFTPDLHEAVAVTDHPDATPGTILEVLRRGYLWNEELLRPAQVRVAKD